MAVSVLVPLLIPLGEQITNETNFTGTGSLIFEKEKYEVAVRENEAPLLLTTIRAFSTISKDVTYKIVSATNERLFSLHSYSGKLLLNLPLDYETVKKHELIVVAMAGKERTYERVAVNVLDVNDNVPVFLRPLYETQITEEDDRHLPKTILQVTAQDADECSKNALIYSISEDDSFNASLTTLDFFSVVPLSGHVQLLKPLDRDSPRGKAKWRLLVTVSDGFFSAKTRLVVNVKDINDNPPSFKMDLTHASVKENSPAGTEVDVVAAVDPDDPLEGAHAVVRYSLEKNVIDETSGRSIFSIDPDTGRITTVLCCLDREKASSYSLQVVATDGGGLKGTGSVLVTVEDENDCPPKFAQKEWQFDIHESAQVNTTVASLLVEDADIKNDFYFKILHEAGFGWEFFGIRSSKNASGDLFPLVHLDFEDPKHRLGFQFQVLVSDRDKNFKDLSTVDSAWVRLSLVDDNDNVPEFLTDSVNITLPEDTPLGMSLANFKAYDKDKGGKGVLHYRIDLDSDKNRLFTVTPSGVVTLARPLDREREAVHNIRVVVEDEGDRGHSAFACLNISVIDVNDNPPFISLPSEVIIEENQRPQYVFDVLLDDPDDWTLGHGPPFSLAMEEGAPEDIRSSFSIKFESEKSGRGIGKLSTLLPLDREKGKIRLIPIVISDAKRLSATVTMSVTVGDINDNPLAPGEKHVTVIRVQGQREHSLPLGRVYVEDLDDWDTADKHWILQDTTSYLRKLVVLNPKTGFVYLSPGVTDGHDFAHRQSNVPADVIVTISTLPHEALSHAVPVLISSHSPKQLITVDKDGNSPLLRLISTLESEKQINVEVLSLESYKSAAESEPHSWLWLSSKQFSSLDQFILLNKRKLSETTQVFISDVGLQGCGEIYQGSHNSSENSLSTVVDANSTALVSPVIISAEACRCIKHQSTPARHRERTRHHHDQYLMARVRTPTSSGTCKPNQCLNGGICLPTSRGTWCVCPENTFGENCKILSRTFNKRGWAWLPPWPLCGTLHFALEFKTKEKDGTLLYSGPDLFTNLTSKSEGHGVSQEDTILLKLQDEMIRLYIITDPRPSPVLKTLSGPSGSLADGAWHRIDLIRSKQTLEVIVDMCQIPDANCHMVINLSPRPLQAEQEETKTQLTPVHVGGVSFAYGDEAAASWAGSEAPNSLQGCIRNVRMNGKLLDVGEGIVTQDSYAGCKDKNDNCNNASVCFQNKRYRCESRAATVECNGQSPVIFSSRSYVKVALSFSPASSMTSFRLRFRTRTTFGFLLVVSSQHERDQMVLYLLKGHICLRLTFHSMHDLALCLTQGQVNDGAWHDVYGRRFGQWAEIWVDNGDWPFYNASFYSFHQKNHGSKKQPKKLLFSLPLVVDQQEGVYLGGKPEYMGVNLFNVKEDFRDGCISDVWLNGRPLPLPPIINTTDGAQTSSFANVYSSCSIPNMCLNVSCPKPLQCTDLWGKYECRCPNGNVLNLEGTLCQDINECIWYPCFNGGTCVNKNPGYNCICPSNYFGTNCESSRYSSSKINLTIGALIAVIAFSILFFFIVIWILYRRRRARRSSAKINNRRRSSSNLMTSQNKNGVFELRTTKETLNGGPIICKKVENKELKNVESMSKWKQKLKIANKNENKKKKTRDCQESGSACQHLQLSFSDDLRYYAYEGDGSIPSSLSSCCSGGDKSIEGKLFEGFSEVSNLLNCLNGQSNHKSASSSKCEGTTKQVHLLSEQNCQFSAAKDSQINSCLSHNCSIRENSPLVLNYYNCGSHSLPRKFSQCVHSSHNSYSSLRRPQNLQDKEMQCSVLGLELSSAVGAKKQICKACVINDKSMS